MEPSGGIIWLASFPKSGNTWFRIFLANLTEGKSRPADINSLDEPGGIASSRHEFEAATFLDSGLLSHDDVDRLRPYVYARTARNTTEQRWIKVHDAYTLTSAGEPIIGRDLAKGAVYLVRDPRDVAISLAFHNGTTIDESIELMNAPDSALCRSGKGQAPQLRQQLLGWSGHVTSWLDQHDLPVHVIRYEDLVSDPAKHFAAALAFAHRPTTAEQIELAIRHSDFAELKRQEDEKGFAERMSGFAPFFRSGQVGGWRAALSPENTAAIEAVHGSVMKQFGYAT